MNIALTTERLNEVLFNDFIFFHYTSNAETHDKKITSVHAEIGSFSFHEISIPGITIFFSKIISNRNLQISATSEDSKLVMRNIFLGSTSTSLSSGKKIMEYRKPSTNMFYSPSYDLVGCVEAGEFEEASILIDLGIVKDLMTEEMIGQVDFLSRISKNDMAYLNPTNPVGIEPFTLSVLHDIRECRLKGHMLRWYIQTKVIELFLLQLADYSGLSPGLEFSARDREIFYGIREYLTDNYLQPQSLSEIAKKFGINTSKLKAGFKKTFNQSVIQYLTGLRMDRAKALLQTRTLNVKEVSDLLNYSHANHFSSAFKKWYGVAPNVLLRK